MTRTGLLRVIFPQLLRLPVLHARSFSAASFSPASFPQKLFSATGATWSRLQNVRGSGGPKAGQPSAVPALQYSSSPEQTAEALEVEGEREEEEEEEGFEVEGPVQADTDGAAGHGGKGVKPLLRVLREGQHSLERSSIPAYAWRVLDDLRKAGFEAYLVGGGVRDLLLERTPKDFDVLSTASPRQVKQLFGGQAMVVGRRFPICHVRQRGTIVEVSSFGIEARLPGAKRKRQEPRGGPKGTEESPVPTPLFYRSKYEWGERDTARFENARKRDFTVNALLYDPFEKVVYDYVGGVRDLNARKVRTIIPAKESFAEDAARYLRAIRLAARLGLSLDRSISQLLEASAPAVATVSKSRLMLEMQALLGYGAAEASLRLLWRFHLLELLLPLQADYLRNLNFARRSKKSNFLLDVMGNLDRMVNPSQPCHGALWTALLAFQLAVAELAPEKVVMAAAALAVCDRKGIQEASWKAQRIDWRVREEEKQRESAQLGETQDKQASPAADGPAASERRGTQGAADTNAERVPSGEGSGEAEEAPDTRSQEGAVEAEGGKREKGRRGAPRGAQEEASTSEASPESIPEKALKLGLLSMERLRDLTDPHITSELVKESPGLDPGDLIVVPKANQYKAYFLLRGISPDATCEDFAKGAGGGKQDKGRRGREPRQSQVANEDEENRNAAYLFSRIVLNTIYPRPGKSQ